MEDLVERCCVCNSTIIDGSLVGKGFYDPSSMKFTDLVLSRECALNKYGYDVVKIMENVNTKNGRGLELFRYESCSQKNL